MEIGGRRFGRTSGMSRSRGSSLDSIPLGQDSLRDILLEVGARTLRRKQSDKMVFKKIHESLTSSLFVCLLSLFLSF